MIAKPGSTLNFIRSLRILSLEISQAPARTRNLSSSHSGVSTKNDVYDGEVEQIVDEDDYDEDESIMWLSPKDEQQKRRTQNCEQTKTV